jgi:hypothetical protein
MRIGDLYPERSERFLLCVASAANAAAACAQSAMPADIASVRPTRPCGTPPKYGIQISNQKSKFLYCIWGT